MIVYTGDEDELFMIPDYIVLVELCNSGTAQRFVDWLEDEGMDLFVDHLGETDWDDSEDSVFDDEEDW